MKDSQNEGSPKTRTKILIVEDESMLLEVLNDEFTKAGFRVLEARDGMAGLVLAAREIPDVMLVDVLMPKMDGITMLKKIRQNPALASIPGIILTNMNDTKTIQAALPPA